MKRSADAMQTTDVEKMEPKISLSMKWNSNLYPITLDSDANIFDLKLKIAETTRVLPNKQKILGLIKGKLPEEDVILADLNLKDDHGFFMMGTPDDDALQEPNFELLPDILNDLDYDYAQSEAAALEHYAATMKKLQNTIETSHIKLMHPLRPGKKLLVLDLDYTLFDCKGTTERLSELLRPGTHEMLSVLYQYYDVCVWSQTSWRWLEAKLTDLGFLMHERYKLAFVMDKSVMFTVTRQTKSKERKSHDVKALQIIWSHFPQFSAANTIHIDDLGRNGALNPQSLLKIIPFKNAQQARLTDRELFHLTRYLLMILQVDDWTTLKHNKWKDFEGEYPKDLDVTMSLFE